MVNDFNALHNQFTSFQEQCKSCLGISALHIETNRQVHFNAEHHFFMCSTYKLPIAVCLLQQVAIGQIQLSQLYEVTEFDLRIGVLSTLNQFNFSHANLHISVGNLLQLMLQESCNSATDILLRLIGGPPAVMNCLHRAGVQDLHIEHYTLELLAALDGIENLPANHQCSPNQYKKLEQLITPKQRLKARMAFKTNLNFG